MKRVGRFDIQEKLGEGEMGTVYRALDPLIERTVAIKAIPLDLPAEEKRLFEDRFLREARSAGKLSHPNIVTIFDVGETEDFAYIAMEYLAGKSLREILLEHGPLPVELAVTTALQMADALSFAHDHGIVHRDIKPANVMVVGKRGTVKLTDFGIAHLMSSGETRGGMLMGSPRYMSPEQVQGKPLDGRSDIFSLGIVLYEMLAGHPPFDGDTLQGILFRIVNDPVPPVSRVRPGAPEQLDEVLARCLAKHPGNRYSTAAELAHDLKALLQGDSLVPTGRVANPALPKSLVAVAFGMPLLIALLLAVGLIVVTFALERDRQQPLASAPPVAAPEAVTITAPPSSINPPAASRDRPDQEGPVSQEAGPQAKRSLPAKQPEDLFLVELDKKLAKLRVERAGLLSTYTELHPDVALIDRQIKQLEDRRQDHLKQQGHQNK